MLRQVKSTVVPLITFTLIAGTVVLIRLGLAMQTLR